MGHRPRAGLPPATLRRVLVTRRPRTPDAENADREAMLAADRCRERISDVKRDQRQRGRYLGGKVPFGFRVGEGGTLEPVPEQQAVIARAGKLRTAGKPLRAIQQSLEAEHGQRVSLDALSRVLREDSGFAAARAAPPFQPPVTGQGEARR